MCRIGAISLTNAVAVGGGERVTMATMFVGRVVLMLDGIIVLFLPYETYGAGVFLFLPEPLQG